MLSLYTLNGYIRQEDIPEPEQSAVLLKAFSPSILRRHSGLKTEGGGATPRESYGANRGFEPESYPHADI